LFRDRRGQSSKVPTSAEVSIDPDELLYRRLAPKSHIKPDGSIASTAYKLDGRPDFEPSVDLAKVTTPQESLSRAGRAGFQLGELRVGSIISLGFKVRPDPIDGNPAHCIIEGNTSMNACSLLAENTRLVPGISST
jgi:hypothetical protein